MVSKNFLRALILVLGIGIGLPVWGLSGFAPWGIAVALTTMIFLDIMLLRPVSKKMKLACMAIYTGTMVCVVVWLLGM